MNNESGRFYVLVKEPDQPRPIVVERCWTLFGARAIGQAYFAKFRSMGFSSPMKLRDNHEITMRSKTGQTANIMVYFVLTEDDLRADIAKLVELHSERNV